MPQFPKNRKSFLYVAERQFGASLAISQRDWYSKVVKCVGCPFVGIHWKGKPVNVAVSGGVAGCGGELNRAGISVIHQDFAREIGEFVSDFVVGTCEATDQDLGDHYRSIYPLAPIVLRSAKPKRMPTKYKSCVECGTSYVLAPERPICVLESEIKGRAVLFTPEGWPLIDSEIYNNLDLFFRKRATITEFPVVSRPLDDVELPGDVWKTKG